MDNLARVLPAYKETPSLRKTAAVAPGSSWDANLQLQFEPRRGTCRLVDSRHVGPLYVQKPFYPEGRDLAHVYLLHPPGGLVSGDKLTVDITLESEARLLLTTPGAGRVYRARQDRCLQQQINTAVLKSKASLEWFPQETIVYPGARGQMDTRFDLDADSQLIAWEISCLGLPASNELFHQGEIAQRLMVCRQGRPILVENLRLNESTRALFDAAPGLRGFPVSGLFVAGFLSDEKIQESQDLLREVRSTLDKPALAGISFVNGLLVGRYLGHSAEQARAYFVELWRLIRPTLLGREYCLPRVWAT